MRIFKFIALIICSLVFLSSILFLNSEGTTRGSGPAFFGFIFIFPSFFGMLKIRLVALSKWINLTVGIIAILYTAFSYFEARIKIDDLSSTEKIYWAPDTGYQLLAVILCCLLIFSSFKIFLKNKKLGIKLNNQAFAE